MPPSLRSRHDRGLGGLFRPSRTLLSLDLVLPNGYNGRDGTPAPGIDLHAHTTASDGSLSPTELVDRPPIWGWRRWR